MTAPHPAVAAVLAEMPVGRDGNALTGWHVQRDQRGEDLSVPMYGDPEPLAAKYVVAAVRWVNKWRVTRLDNGECVCPKCMADLADEIAASVQP